MWLIGSPSSITLKKLGFGFIRDTDSSVENVRSTSYMRGELTKY